MKAFDAEHVRQLVEKSRNLRKRSQAELTKARYARVVSQTLRQHREERRAFKSA